MWALADLPLSLGHIVDLALVPVAGPLHHFQARQQGVLLLLQLFHLLQLCELKVKKGKGGCVVAEGGTGKGKKRGEERENVIKNRQKQTLPGVTFRQKAFIFYISYPITTIRLLPRLNLIIDFCLPAACMADKLPSFHEGICSKLFCVSVRRQWRHTNCAGLSLPSWTMFRGAISPASWQPRSNLRMG